MGRVINLAIDETVARALIDGARAKDLTLDSYLTDLLEQERQRRLDDVEAGLKTHGRARFTVEQIGQVLTEARAELEARIRL